MMIKSTADFWRKSNMYYEWKWLSELLRVIEVAEAQISYHE